MSRTIACLAFCLLTFISAACEKAALLAPTGSAVTLSINTTTVAVNGTAQITAVVIEDGGNAPQNGTQVTFTTTLGSIDPIDAQTHNGRATATFSAGTRSGTANVRAFSGDAEAEAVEVLVGGGGAAAILLRIESSTNNGESTTIVARVIDAGGNPIPGAPVSFSSDKGRLTSGSATADSIGEARVTLLTSEQTVVTATTGGSGSQVTATITIGAPGSFTIAVTTPAPPALPQAGQPVTFTIAPTTNAFFTGVVVTFGDGQQENIGTLSAQRTLQHIYSQRGTYTVTARASNGESATTTVTVTEAAPLTFTTSVAPSSVVSLASNQVLTFTISAPQAGGTAAVVSQVDWDFGNGASTTTTSLTTSYRYPATGTFIYTIRVQTIDGREGVGTGTVRVTP